jgi:hypothetical protein
LIAINERAAATDIVCPASQAPAGALPHLRKKLGVNTHLNEMNEPTSKPEPKGNRPMKKSLYAALGLAVALAISAPVITPSANAAAATTAAPTTTVKKATPKHHVKKQTTSKKHAKKPAAQKPAAQY